MANAHQSRVIIVGLQQWNGDLETRDRFRQRGTRVMTSPFDAPPAPAGWYPAATGWQRWWDGAQWIGDPVPVPHMVTEQPVVVAPPPSGAPVTGLPPVETPRRPPPVTAPPAAPAPATRPLAAPAETEAATGYPPSYATVDGARVLVEGTNDERTEWYTASWIGVFFFAPLAIIGGLIDNSKCKARGLSPKYGAIITGTVLWVVGTIVVFSVMQSSATASCLTIANEVVASSKEQQDPNITVIGGIAATGTGPGTTNCRGKATWSDGEVTQLVFYETDDAYHWAHR